jgi:predicted Rossmann-fold nucleotide-binding protein
MSAPVVAFALPEGVEGMQAYPGWFLVVVAAGIAALAGCAAPPPAGGMGAVELRLACPTAGAEVPNADYVGRYAGVENVIPLQEMAQDIHCSDSVKAQLFPGGYVTIYGSSRIQPCRANSNDCQDAGNAANDALYASVRRFAQAWTTRHGRKHPIMTGAGPGLMEAGNRGAKEAGGPSVGYTTYYDSVPNADPARPYGGNPRLALNPYVTNGLIFSSVAMREQAMIKHSAAIVIGPGGTGTEWELFQIVETLKSRQLAKVPVYLVGNRQLHWSSLEARLADMVARRTVRREEVAFLKFVEDDQELVRQLAADLGLN